MKDKTWKTNRCYTLCHNFITSPKDIILFNMIVEFILRRNSSQCAPSFEIFYLLHLTIVFFLSVFIGASDILLIQN